MNSLITFAAESGRQLRLRDYVTFAASQAGGLVANTAHRVRRWLTSFRFGRRRPSRSARALWCNFSLSHLLVFRRRDTRRYVIDFGE